MQTSAPPKRHSELDSESINVSHSALFGIDPVENQTFFTKSKILEKAVNQVQGDYKITIGLRRKNSEFDNFKT